MKKVAILFAAIGVFFIAIPVAYSTVMGHMHWYFLMPASDVTVGGRAIDAWVHRGQSGRDLIVTWDSAEARSSYYAVPSSEFVGGRCPVAPRLPVFAEGDLHDSGCFRIVESGAPLPVERKRNVEVNRRMFAFDDDMGRRVVVHW